MKTIKPKAKSKKNNARFPRVKISNKESVEDVGPDLSQLRKPIDISVSSLLEVTKLLENGGDEIKIMLAYECDVVYECRVCRSLFRSLANFISHKRVYCREKFNIALCRKARNDRIISAEDFYLDRELAEDGNSKEDDNNIRILRSQVVRKSLKKDLTSVVDMLQKKQSEDINENLLESSFAFGTSNSKVKGVEDSGIEIDKTNPQVLLEPIESTKTAVYQTATASTVNNADLMKAQIAELLNMANQNTAILNPDGRSVDANQLEKSDSPLQIYGSDDEEEVSASADGARDLVCSVCNAKFSTRKTLTYHMKSLHVSYRTCYPCPCCTSTFANTWSVYRHLFKVHRKTNIQVRKLRTQIQEKAFRKETTGTEEIEKENSMIKSTGAPDLEMNNTMQEWMEHFELDSELQRCGGCGRRFDRRAALISHSALCQKRIAACNEAAGNKSKRLSKTPSPKNVVEDNNALPKEPSNCIMLKRAQSSKKKIPQKTGAQLIKSPINTVAEESDKARPEVINNRELSIRVENVSRISDADWEMMDNNSSRSPLNQTPSPSSAISMDKAQTSPVDDESNSIKVPDSPEIIFTSIDKARTVAISFGPKKRRVSLINNSRELSNGSVSGNNEDSVQTSPDRDKKIFETNHRTLMENRIATIANLRKMQCLPCRKKFTSMTNLRRHMAVHIGWHRYRCKLCDYKCFVKCDCVAHCNKYHDAKNNRAIIADMVIQIPPDQSVLGQEIMMDLSKSYAAISEPELIDVTESSSNSINVTGITRNTNGIEPTDGKSSKENIQSVEERLNDDKEPNQQDLELDWSGKLDISNEEKGLKESDREETLTQAEGKLNKDPELRKMIMEVIFGTSESGSVGGSEIAEIRKAKNSELKVLEGQKLPVKINKTIKETAIINENSKSRTCLSTSKLQKDEIKLQRPTRNRVKPVHEDFIYDLTELIRKESAIHKAGVAVTSQKMLKKKQQQAIAENEDAREPKSEGDANEVNKLSSVSTVSSLLSQKKGESYNSKLSTLKQAEVRLSNTLSGIMSAKNIRSTKISILSQK